MNNKEFDDEDFKNNQLINNESLKDDHNAMNKLITKLTKKISEIESRIQKQHH